MSIADDILGKGDLPVEKVHVPEWDMDLFVRTMTGKQRDTWEGLSIDWRKRCLGGSIKKAGDPNVTSPEESVNARARLLVCCLCDEAGELVFKPDQVEALGSKSASALDRLFSVALKLNKISDSDIEELEGN